MIPLFSCCILRVRPTLNFVLWRAVGNYKSHRAKRSDSRREDHEGEEGASAAHVQPEARTVCTP